MTTNKQDLAVTIVRFVDDGFPGWVECQFADAEGRVHTIVDKYPMLSSQTLDADSRYPQPGEIECEVLSRSPDSAGREVVRIRTLGIESTEGLSEFAVTPGQLSKPRISPPTSNNPKAERT